jgi:hypothetical protein
MAVVLLFNCLRYLIFFDEIKLSLISFIFVLHPSSQWRSSGGNPCTFFFNFILLSSLLVKMIGIYIYIGFMLDRFLFIYFRSIKYHWILYQHCRVHFMDVARNLFIFNFRVCFLWMLLFWGFFKLSSKAIYFFQILFWLITYNFNNY